MINDLWYKNSVIYRLSVAIYMDANGDDIGDFQGLMRGLDCLQELGVTALWLMPFQPSPCKDDGYDVADYYGVNPRYGGQPGSQRMLTQASCFPACRSPHGTTTRQRRHIIFIASMTFSRTSTSPIRTCRQKLSRSISSSLSPAATPGRWSKRLAMSDTKSRPATAQWGHFRDGDETDCTLVNLLSEDHSHPEKRQAPYPIRALRLPLVSH